MSDDFDPDQEQERLDRMEDKIQQVRREVDSDSDSGAGAAVAEDSDLPAGGDRTFVDSGEEGDEYDDQTIAPPG